MKQRMYNTFSRIFKNHAIAKVLSEVGYALLMAYYMVARNFVKSRGTIDVSSARNKLQEFSSKPAMETNAVNKEYSKDLSIVVPAYNSEKTIKECIESVIKQTTKYDYEVIVVNDGSTDETGKIVKAIGDERIILINQSNKGFSGARNRGIDESNG